MNKKVVKNASWIIVCRILQSVLSMIIAMISARYLGPSNYGIINYAASIVSFVAPIMYLGFNNTLVQELIETPEYEGKTMGTAICMSVVTSIVCMVGIACFVIIANPGERTTIIVCVLYSTLLIFQAIDLMQYWYQKNYISKYASIVMLIAYFVMSLYRIWLLVTAKSIEWFAVAAPLEYLVIAIALVIIYFKLGGMRLSVSLTHGRKMLKRSGPYIVAGLMVTVFSQTDKIMLKLMLGDSSTGYYSASVACATLSSFVFAAIIDSVRPSALEAFKEHREKMETIVSKLYCVIIYLSFFQSILMTIFAPIIIKVLYGGEYKPAIACLQIAVWFTTFAYLGAVRNVWILAEQKQKYLWIINLSGALINVMLNWLFIPIWGINGAAWASVITQFFTNVITGFIIRPVLKNNILMIRGLDPRIMMSILSSEIEKKDFLKKK